MPAEVTAMEKVLVIDDELGPRESIRFLLKNEFEVFCADTVDKGIVLLREKTPDLVVLDIRMPGKTGIQGLSEVRAIDPHVSVVMLTGYGALETAQEAIRLGATDYMSKPFDTEEMRQAVRRYVKRSKVERKRVTMLRELQEINSQLVKEVADKTCTASQADSSSEIAHDMRNPLMVVNGYVELLAEQIERTRQTMGDEYEKAADYLDVIGQNVRRCCELMKLWQKTGKGRANELAMQPVRDLLETVRRDVTPLAATAGVELAFEVKEDVGAAVVKASRAQLVRAFYNVVANAVDAVAGRSGRVAVSGVRDGQWVRIRVRDNGCGMSKEVLARLFEPYFTTKAEGKGTGLGMVITRKVMEQHGGSIEVESVPDEGTCMTLSLPVP
jgi:signal transduction histidine kinase